MSSLFLSEDAVRLDPVAGPDGLLGEVDVLVRRGDEDPVGLHHPPVEGHQGHQPRRIEVRPGIQYQRILVYLQYLA